jgi:hypothetical protein
VTQGVGERQDITIDATQSAVPQDKVNKAAKAFS